MTKIFAIVKKYLQSSRNICNREKIFAMVNAKKKLRAPTNPLLRFNPIQQALNIEIMTGVHQPLDCNKTREVKRHQREVAIQNMQKMPAV